jgi:hypothetical protein
MIDLNHSIRLHQAADFPADGPETRYVWRGKLLIALAVLGALGAVWLAWVVLA